MSALITPYLNPASNPQVFVWDKRKCIAAGVLAAGCTKTEAAREADVDRSTIYEWLKIPDFCEEVDRLTVMVGISTRAERLRVAMRVVNQRIDADGNVITEKDILDWLKFAQSETDGVKLDIGKLLAAEGDTADGGESLLP